MTKKISFCMIVKDEEQNLHRCLGSLRPILDQDYAELIIVDTGSTDRTVEIAKEYTSHIYFHEWNGNFSSMRNISISYATGEWIFIIDADEELETPDELIALLHDPKLSNFNTVRIREKNLLSIQSKKYVYHVQERMFRNDGTFEYRGTIHNQPIYKHPVLIKDIWLMHYGYISEDKELMEKKFKRTATMLKKELEKDPDHVYYRFQLARSYMMHNESATALEEMTKAYQSMKKQPKELIVHRYYVFGEYARMLLNAKKHETVIEICKEGLSYSPNYLDLYYYMGHSYVEMEQYEEGLSALEKYVQLHEKYNAGQLELSNFTAIEMYTLDELSYNITLNQLVRLIYSKHIHFEPSKYKKWIKNISNKNLSDKLNTQLLLLEDNYVELRKLYQGIDEKEKGPFVNYLESLKKEWPIERKELFTNAFSELEDSYGLLNQIRLSENRKPLLIQFINQYNIIEYSDEVILEFVHYLLEEKCLNRLFKKLDSSTIKKIVKVLIDQEGKEPYFLQSLRNDFKYSDFHNNRIFIAIANVILLSKAEEKNWPVDLDEQMIRDLFNQYIHKGIEFIKSLYNIERIRLTYPVITNKEEKFLILLYLAECAKQAGDRLGYHRYIKEATEEYPYLSRLLREYVIDGLANLETINR
ncbi:glycosyltransferase family 2 protein [Paenibacillus ginsengihumi]|uniref:glycosyltransferase family 2 protein n=1 Tax=Paenibacillus ginsengihumi TaxID=431596 RepID=UPI00036E8572|nr:glycosyltransferase family 2 protein [Paenibacillus ginsengihumi]